MCVKRKWDFLNALYVKCCFCLQKQISTEECLQKWVTVLSLIFQVIWCLHFFAPKYTNIKYKTLTIRNPAEISRIRNCVKLLEIPINTPMKAAATTRLSMNVMTYYWPLACLVKMRFIDMGISRNEFILRLARVICSFSRTRLYDDIFLTFNSSHFSKEQLYSALE